MSWATRGIYCRTKRGTRGPRTGRRVGAVLVRDWRCLESLFLPFSSNRASSLPVSGFQNLLILSVCPQSFSPRNAPRAGQRSLVVEAVEAECLGSCLGPVPARPPGFGHTVLCSRALIRNELVHASRSPSFRVPTTSALGASKREVWSSPALPGVVCAGHLLTQDRPLLLRPAGLSGAASGEPPCLAGPRFSAVGEEIEPIISTVPCALTCRERSRSVWSSLSSAPASASCHGNLHISHAPEHGRASSACLLSWFSCCSPKAP